ncbi:beta strand repeat-containing protein [Lutimaribacter marinistellae]|uniref:Beta strand repeat-containing protein n=1 Tax=Lutimaribacter marinistellae TaxID=1820329 RepID=A0ABV7TDW2_9RHOB
MTITPFLWGPERLINSRIVDAQRYPSVEVAPNGNFVVAYQTQAYGASNQIGLRILNEAGGPIGAETRVGGPSPGVYATAPSVAVLNNGNIVVGYTYGGIDVRATILSSDASEVIAEIVLPRAPQDVVGPINQVTLTALDSGGFAAAWTQGNFGDQDIRYATFSATGTRQTLLDGLASTSTGNHRYADIAKLNNGNVVIVWERELLNGNKATRAKIVTETGVTVVSEFAVNSNTSGDELRPSVTTLTNGDFVVAWDQAGDHQFRIFNEDATPVTSDISQTALAGNAEVKALNDGGFLLVGIDSGSDLSAQRYDASGATVGSLIQVNTTATDSQILPAVAVNDDGRALVVWEDLSQTPDDTDDRAIRGQMLSLTNANNAINGGSGNNVLFGNNFANEIYGNAGNDTITAQGGDDFVDGGADDDLFHDTDFPSGDDYDGGLGTDTLDWSTLTFASGRVTVDIGEGHATSTLTGLSDTFRRIEVFRGSQGDETYIDDTGGTTIFAEGGEDTVQMRDVLFNGDAYHGGTGYDTFDLSAIPWIFSPTINLATNSWSHNGSAEVVSSFEHIIGGNGLAGENLIGNSLANEIHGNGAEDTISGGGGADTLRGGDDDDEIQVFAGEATSGMVLDGGADFDRLVSRFGGTHSFQLTSLSGFEELAFEGAGGTNSAVFYAAQFGPGLALDANIIGDPTFGRENEIVVVMGPRVTLDLSSLNFSNWSGEDRVIVNGDSSSDNIIGSEVNDQINAGSGNNIIDAGLGRDTVTGGGNRDIFVDTNNGASQNIDVYNGGGGRDQYQATAIAWSSITEFDLLNNRQTVSGGLLRDQLFDIEDLLVSGSAALRGDNEDNLLEVDNSVFDGNNLLRGEGGNDELRGDSGNDTLIGGIGFDTLVGGSGNDELHIDQEMDVVTELALGGNDTIVSWLQSTHLALYNHVENLHGAGGFGQQLYGNSNANRVSSDGEDAILYGNDGNDTLIGDVGSNIFVGGVGNDRIVSQLDGRRDLYDFTLGHGHDVVENFEVEFDEITMRTQDYEVLEDTAGVVLRSTDGSTSMTLEGVDYADFRRGNLNHLTKLGERTSLTLDHNVSTYAFDGDYQNPVVFATVVTNNGISPVTVRILDIDVNAKTVDLRLQEPSDQDDIHFNETVHLTVVEAGAWMQSNDRYLEAGTFDTNQLTTDGFDTVAFQNYFADLPVVHSQVQTFNGSDFVATRQTLPSRTTVGIALQEDEAGNSGFHNTETVGYMARSKYGPHPQNGYLGTADGIGGAFARVEFGETLATYWLQANIASFNGNDPATIRIDALGSQGFEARAQEDTARDAETFHDPETISISADLTNLILGGRAMPAIGEVRSLRVNEQPVTLELHNDYDKPVVVAHVATRNGISPVTVRITDIDVQTDTISLRLQEPRDQDDVHFFETVHVMVMEAGRWETPDGRVIEAGTIDTNTLSGNGFELVEYAAMFDERPVVLSQVQSNNGFEFVSTRQTLTSNPFDSFAVALQEDEAGNTGFHVSETIGYIATEVNVMGNASGTNISVSGTSPYTYPLANMDALNDAPLFFGQVNSSNDSDPVNTRGVSATSDELTFWFEEDTAADPETTHGSEEIGLVAFDSEQLLRGIRKDGAVGEFHQISVAPSGISVTLDNEYDNPVVIARVSSPGSLPIVVRVTDIDTVAGSVTIATSIADGPVSSFGSQTISLLVVEAGTYEMEDGTRFTAGTIETDNLTTDGFEQVSFANGLFDARPVVVTSIQTNNEGGYALTRMRNVDATGFEVAMQEQESTSFGGGASHATETIGYFAVEEANGVTGGRQFAARSLGDTVDENPVTIPDDFDYLSNRLIFPSLASYDGTDPASVRTLNNTIGQFDLHVVEDQSTDGETAHLFETVDYMVFDGSGELNAHDLIL